ncbi:MAG: DUF3857 domain-containing protein [Dysgonomonas sp.]|nr:DUF3857 domain-containing protein [Dysgonomonas sp.]
MNHFRFLTLLFFILFSLTSYSQSKYGNATEDELKMAEYPQDTTAAAVILLKKGETRVVFNDLYGFQFEYSIQTKIKILKTEGLDWCNHEISYLVVNNRSKEDIRSLSGTTYNLEDGKIIKTKLSKEYIFDEDVEGKWKIKKITMPAAKVGSVIEYKYTIVSDFFYELRSFDFQTTIPIMHASFEYTLPEYFYYNVNMQGYIQLKRKHDTTNETFRIQYKDGSGKLQFESIRCSGSKTLLQADNVPALKDEKHLWTINDYISRISFELKTVQMPYSLVKNYSSSWADIDKEILNNSYGGNLKRSDLFKDEISKTEINIDRAKEIQNVVKQKVKWNDKNSGVPSNLKNVLKNGIGNSADLNFLLINALKSGGFEAFPVILSTRSHGRLPVTHPSITAFNYVITGVQIDTMTYYTDASEKYGDWNLLPTKCMVPQARVLTSTHSDWVDLSTTSSGLVFMTGKFNLTDNKYQGAVTVTQRGNAALDMRNKYSSYKNDDEFIESLKKETSSEIDDFKITDLDNTNAPLKIEYTQSTDINLGDEYIYINPMINRISSDNPFKQEKRVLPVNFNYLMNYVQIVDIEVPDGYTVEELPKPEKFVLNDNDISFSYRIAQSGNQIKLHYQFQLKKLLFLPEEYESLRDFYSKLVLKNSEQIVLKKATATE